MPRDGIYCRYHRSSMRRTRHRERGCFNIWDVLNDLHAFFLSSAAADPPRKLALWQGTFTPLTTFGPVAVRRDA
jgi:hypothetical protein